MGLDYYEILGLTRSATCDEIKKAYRSLALKLHPLISSEGEAGREKFTLVCEAYEVLSNTKLKMIFDHFGEEGLKNGAPIGDTWSKKYEYHGDICKTFQNFFGGDNPFECTSKRINKELEVNFGGRHGRGQLKQDPPIEQDLYLSLEEVFKGCVKKMKISRRTMNSDHQTSCIRDKVLTMHIKPGWREGTRITFAKEGDQADIVFILRDREHENFKRKGSDLIYTAKVHLAQALMGCILDIKTLDDRILHVPITEVIHPKYVKTVPKEGMPINGEYDKKGDLYIVFDIIFPKMLNSHQKEKIEEAFLP